MALTRVSSQMLSGNSSSDTSVTGFGVNALNSNSGIQNTAVGGNALYSNTSASGNTAFGYAAGYSNTSGGTNCTYIGKAAGYTATGQSNTFVGAEAGYSVSTGTGNTFIGGGASGIYSSGYFMTTGSKNTILGNFPGNQDGLDIRTSSNYIVLADGDGKPKAYNDGSSWYFKVGASFNRTLAWDGAELYPAPDNTASCAHPSFRWTVVYAVSGSINTSDATQKQQIRSLDDAEKAVATRIKGLIKTFKFNDAVEKKGDGARIHVGVIAQEVRDAFIAENLDPNKYAMFCSDTWYEVDGKAAEPTNPYTAETEGAMEVTRLGIRYDELLAFVIAAL